MVDVNMRLADCKRSFRRWTYLVKSDPDGVGKLRIFLLAFLVAAGLVYAGYVLVVEPQTKILATKNKEYLAVKNGSSGKVSAILSEAYRNLHKQNQELQTKIGVLQLQNSSVKEMWHSVADQQSFAQAVLSLLPAAPAALAQGMSRLGQLAPVEEEDLTVFPVTIEGRTSYGQLLDYLQYLEGRPEVGVLDKLTISATSDATTEVAPGEELSFQIRAGRIKVKEF